jgi:hypothetical protein
MLAVIAGLAGLAGISGIALAGLAVGPAAPPAPAAAGLDEREVRYLETGIDQLRKMERKLGRLGSQFQQNLGAGALASAALADRRPARPDQRQRRDDAVRWATAALDACVGHWGTNKCARTEIPLQRLVLQYPDVLPAELLVRLRGQVSAGAPPPSPEAVRDPWSFRETENQRMVTMARSLAGQTVAGTPDSPAARGWGAYAEAFLRAHDRDGWYEAESPGYMAVSITMLLQLADHAPQASVRALAAHQLDLLFAAWAQNQVGGYPAGAKSRTYSFWALSDRSTPWAAWAWMAAGIGDPETINFMDRPELPVSRYRIPDGVARLLVERRRQPVYEIRERRRINLGKRKDLDTALYSYATPDYILGTAQAVDGLSLEVSGGQEIAATLYPEGAGFAPLYLWSRTRQDTGPDRWRSWQDRAVGYRNLAVARLGTMDAPGHAYLAPAWSRPEPAGERALVSRCGDAYVTLVAEDGWEVDSAQKRFPAYYGPAKSLVGSWVAVPRRQPAQIAIEVGRRSEDGDFAAWRKRAAAARLAFDPAGELRFTASDGTRLDFTPGLRAAVAGRPLEPRAYPLLDGPFLANDGKGGWTFREIRPQ